MNKKLFLILPIFFAVIAFGAVAANPFNIKFPIPELGNCGSLEECKAYCDDSSNADACLSFGEKQGLIKKNEAGQAKKFKNSLSKGDVPVAGCTDEDSCKKLCGLPENRDACFAWAKDHGFVDEGSNQDMQRPSDGSGGINKEKALQAIKANGGPGGCSSFDECGKFCSNPDNQKVCFEYAKKYNLMSAEEANRAERFVSHPGPGGCKGEECQAYCRDQNHRQECVKFAVENGFMTQAQADQQEKYMNLHQNLQNFGGPGGCKGEDECRKYCSDPTHVKECNEFAQKSGLINREEARKHIQDFENFKKENDLQNQDNQDQIDNGQSDDINQNQKGQDQEGPAENFQNNEDGQQVPPQGPDQGNMPPSNRPPFPPNIDMQKFCIEHGGTWQDNRCAMQTQGGNPPPSSSPSPNSVICLPRPACLDAVPRCLIPEPVSGWCSTLTPTQQTPPPSIQQSPPQLPPSSPPTQQVPSPRNSLIQSLIRFLAL